MTTLHQPDTRLKKVESHIPNGLHLILKVSLHDNVGNEFSHNYEDLHALRHRLTNKELVDVHFGGNFTIGLKLLQESSNILGVALKDHSGIKYSEDYIKISVGESLNLFPKKTSFSVGDIICFDSPLLDSTKWYSSDRKSVLIVPETGLAKIMSLPRTSKVLVTHGEESSAFYEFNLDIKGLDKIEFLKRADIFNGERYLGKLVLKHHLQLEKYNNLFARNATECNRNLQNIAASEFFTCHLKVKETSHANILDFFKAQPIFDTKSGTYACVVDPIPSRHELVDIIRGAEVHLDLEARLQNGIMDVATLRIVPAITIEPDILPVDQLDHKLVTITGLDKVIQRVEVKSSHPSDLEVTLHSKQLTAVHYRVRLLKPFTGDVDLSVVVTSPATIQSVEIPIVSPNYIRKCSSQPLVSLPEMLVSSVSGLGFIITSIVLICVVTWSVSYCFQQRQSNLNGSG